MKTFRIDGVEYTLKTYSDNDVCKYIYETLGITSDKMTVAEYTVLKLMLNLGFTPHPSYYGRPTGEMYPQVMWYSYRGARLDERGNYSGLIDIIVCYKINYDKQEDVVVYEGDDKKHKIGVFTNIDDVVRLLKLEEYIPVKPAISPASIDKVVDRVEQEKKDYNYMANGGEIKNPVMMNSFIAYGIDLGSVVTYHIDYSKLEAPDKKFYHN